MTLARLKTTCDNVTFKVISCSILTLKPTRILHYQVCDLINRVRHATLESAKSTYVGMLIRVLHINGHVRSTRNGNVSHVCVTLFTKGGRGQSTLDLIRCTREPRTVGPLPDHEHVTCPAILKIFAVRNHSCSQKEKSVH